MEQNAVQALAKIDMKIAYTNGQDYPNLTEFFIYAPVAGSFTVNCNASYNMPGKGFINVTAEAVDAPSTILTDVTITPEYNPGKITVNIPGRGFYKLTIISKYKTGNHLVIECKGNTFFRKGPFYGNMVENYRENWTGLPRFVHIPEGMNRLFFSVNNACDASGNCISASDVEQGFSIRDKDDNHLSINSSPADPLLFYIDIPQSVQGSFIEVTRMREYNLCFANISNIELYAERKPCSVSDFSIGLIKKNGECMTTLTAASTNKANLHWEILEGSRTSYFNGEDVLELPLLSTSAVISLSTGPSCISRKRTGDSESYKNNFEACAADAPMAIPVPVASPNPSPGIFRFMSNGSLSIMELIRIFDLHGREVKTVRNSYAADLGSFPAGVYIYKITSDGKDFKGRIVKL
jgi:hypothetical protein